LAPARPPRARVLLRLGRAPRHADGPGRGGADRRRPREPALRARPRRPDLPPRRGPARPRDRPRDRPRPGAPADPPHARARRDRRLGPPPRSRSPPPGDPDLPGPPDRGERGDRGAPRRAPRGRLAPRPRRALRGDRLPFPRGPRGEAI